MNNLVLYDISTVCINTYMCGGLGYIHTTASANLTIDVDSIHPGFSNFGHMATSDKYPIYIKKRFSF